MIPTNGNNELQSNPIVKNTLKNQDVKFIKNDKIELDA